MTGLPAISVPVGCDGEGRPVGFQLIGHPWCEGTLLRCGGLHGLGLGLACCVIIWIIRLRVLGCVSICVSIWTSRLRVQLGLALGCVSWVGWG